MKTRSIIIEGLDNCGKTTQIKNLVNFYNHIPYHVVHYSALKHDSTEDCIKYNKQLYFELINMASSFNCIFDRSHLGDWVFGYIYRKYDPSYIFDIEIQNHDLLDNISMIVFVDEPENAIARDDGLSFSIDLKQKQLEKDRFEEAYELSNIKNKTLININGLCEEAVFSKIAYFLEKPC